MFLELPYNNGVIGLTHFIREGMVDVGDDDNGRGVGDDNVYRGRTEPVLILLSDLYPNNKISVSNSRPSFCPTYMFY